MKSYGQAMVAETITTVPALQASLAGPIRWSKVDVNS
jgi:hypothetical protein